MLLLKSYFGRKHKEIASFRPKYFLNTIIICNFATAN